MDNACLVVRKWQVEPAKTERRRWNRRRTTALQTLTNEVVPQCTRAATAHREADERRAGGYSMSLDFFAYFFYQEKKYEKQQQHLILT